MLLRHLGTRIGSEDWVGRAVVGSRPENGGVAGWVRRSLGSRPVGTFLGTASAASVDSFKRIVLRNFVLKPFLFCRCMEQVW